MRWYQINGSMGPKLCSYSFIYLKTVAPITILLTPKCQIPSTGIMAACDRSNIKNIGLSKGTIIIWNIKYPCLKKILQQPMTKLRSLQSKIGSSQKNRKNWFSEESLKIPHTQHKFLHGYLSDLMLNLSWCFCIPQMVPQAANPHNGIWSFI